jgi:hypothetical protein
MKANSNLVVAVLCAVFTLSFNLNASAREISKDDPRFTQLGEYITRPKYNQPTLGDLSGEAKKHLVEKTAAEVGLAGQWVANEHRSSARLCKLSNSAKLLCDPQGDKGTTVSPLYILPCGNRVALVEFVPPAKPEPPKAKAKSTPAPKPEKAKPAPPAPKPEPPKVKPTPKPQVKVEPAPAKPAVINNTFNQFNTTIVVVPAPEPAPTATVETTPPAPKSEEKKVVEVTGSSGAKIEITGGTTVRIIDFTGGLWQQPPCHHEPAPAKKGCD